MSRSHAVLLILLSAIPALAAAADIAPEPQLQAALADARERRAAVLIDFHAPWCYSCYYMARNVLTGSEWDAVRRRAVVLEQDADSPEGAALKARLGVKALPSYVLLDADGRELGRILGEQSRADFYAAVNDLLDRGGTLDALAARVKDGGAASLAAAREVLQSYHARYDGAGGLAWFAGLPAAARAAIEADARGQSWLARLRFLDAAQQHDVLACMSEGPRVLDGALGCQRPYEVDRYLACAADAADKPLLVAQRARMLELVERGAFGKDRCADTRSVVLTTADLHLALGDADAERTLLERAVADVRARIGEDLGKDRNLADNLRVYLERLARRSGDYARLDALMVQLIAAYPEDYVYAFRHGRSLLSRGKAAEALPYLELAAAKAYGINRLQVAEQRVRALRALGRDADARRVVAETLKANGPWFPEEAARLKALLQG
ncbi:thioredoxin family protein [Fontimonas sp. SYSU GA230001]|uniref:thioredoxin family protein n=1 Tax=Fontimonas sp. SYSU GA230001 TaxID=3142450 RepID=UPI0032B596AA